MSLLSSAHAAVNFSSSAADNCIQTMRSFSFDAMIPQLLFITGNGSSQEVVERIRAASQNDAYTEIFLSHVPVDETLLEGVQERLISRKWDGVHLAQCTGMIPQLLQACAPLVEKFSIMGDFECMDKTWCLALSDALKQSRIRKLLLRVQLSLDLADAIHDATSSDNCKLQELILPISQTCNASMERLSQALGQCTTLRTLRVNRHDLTWKMNDYQMETLMGALRCHPTLKELSIQGSSCTDRGMAAICQNVLPTLEKLDLSNHRIGGDPLCGLSFLALALSQPNQLKSLCLSGHVLSESETALLVGAMVPTKRSDCGMEQEHQKQQDSSNCQLEELQLNRCDLNDSAACILGKHVARMPSLAVLQLRDNPFGPDGLEALLSGVSKNWELEQMVLPTTRHTDAVGDEMDRIKAEIFYHLALNRAGRKVLQSDATISLSVWPVLLSRVREAVECDYSSHGCLTGFHCADAIFQLLQGPALLQR